MTLLDICHPCVVVALHLGRHMQQGAKDETVNKCRYQLHAENFTDFARLATTGDIWK